jgi:hypothetical protein
MAQKSISDLRARILSALSDPTRRDIIEYAMPAGVEKAVQESGVEAEMVKVDRIQEIMNRGVMMTPLAHPNLA